MKMKNIRVALLACMVALFAMSCEKNAEENESPAFSGKRFKVEIASFRDANNSKAYLNFTNDLSRIIYENGDKVQINGKSFTLSYEDGEWYANADNGQPYTGKTLYTAYCDGTLNAWDSNASGGPKYNFTINDYLDNNTHNKLLLCGTSNSGSVITLQPACAILRVYTGNSGSSWTNVRVGFEGNKIPASGYIKPATGVITPTAYLEGVSQGSGGSINGDFLAMRWSKQSSAEGSHASSEQGYWYVAIPIPGDEVSTTLYLGWNNGSDVQRKTQGQVTLHKGYVYTVGTERQSPFTANGFSKYRIYVDESNHQVAFSAGNLQCMAYEDEELNEVFKWQFAPSQTSIVGSVGNENIGHSLQWFDLFGYGTSNWSGSGATAFKPYSASTTNSHYYSTNLNGTNADWGVFNRTSPGIYYGTTLVTLNKYRTLTNSEWSHIINRTDGSGNKLSGLVRIGGTYFGLMLLPNTGENGAGTWSNSTDVDVTDLSLTSVKNLTSSDWDKLESIGAIFLPAAGSRTGTDVSNDNVMGYYWTATTSSDTKGYSLNFNNSAVATSASNKKMGCAVRLVAQVGTYTPEL